MRMNPFFDNHTMNLVQAAIPYVRPQNKPSVSLLLQASELVNTINDVNNPPELSAMGLGEEEYDPENMLMSIKEVCTPEEVEIVDIMMNFIKARKIYSAYQDYGSQVLEAAQVNQGQGTNRSNMPNLNMLSMLSMLGGMGNMGNLGNLGNLGMMANLFGMGGGGRNNFGNNSANLGMMDMLMAMLPPEQRSMVEMMSMMNGTMNMGNGTTGV